MELNRRRAAHAACVILLVPCVLQAAEEGAAARPSSPPSARELMLDMARHLGMAAKFAVQLKVEFDVVQEDGRKIEFGEVRDVSLARPRMFLSEHVDSSGRRDLVLFDGETITVSDVQARVYAQRPQPGDLDSSIVYFVRDLGMRMPIAPLFLSRFADELERRVRRVDYVEYTDILGEPAHHLAGQTDAVDFQVWIADAEQPLPLRLVLTYRSEPGQPQFRAEFRRWNLAPRFADGTFVFEPGAGMEKIPFAAAPLGASEDNSGAKEDEK